MPLPRQARCQRHLPCRRFTRVIVTSSTNQGSAAGSVRHAEQRWCSSPAILIELPWSSSTSKCLGLLCCRSRSLMLVLPKSSPPSFESRAHLMRASPSMFATSAGGHAKDPRCFKLHRTRGSYSANKRFRHGVNVDFFATHHDNRC
jgi:hypothetical protein